MSYHEIVVKHFQYRVELFFKTVILDGPFGKTNYYAIRIMQVLGRPHVHSIIWILNAPKLSKFNIEEYIKYIVTQKLAVTIKMKNEDFILVNFLLLELPLHSLCQIFYQLTRKMR